MVGTKRTKLIAKKLRKTKIVFEQKPQKTTICDFAPTVKGTFYGTTES